MALVTSPFPSLSSHAAIGAEAHDSEDTSLEDAFVGRTTRGSSDLCSRSSPVRRLWLVHYHPAFTHRYTRQDEVSASLSSPVDGAPAATLRHLSLKTLPGLSKCIPEEADALPLFVQTLGALGTALQARMQQPSASSDAQRRDGLDTVPLSDALTPRELYDWLSEVQAVLLYVGRRQLRHVIPPRFVAAFSPVTGLHAPSTSSTTVEDACCSPSTTDAEAARKEKEWRRLGAGTSAATNAVSIAESGNDRTLLPHAPSASASPSLRLLSRPHGERLRDKVPPLPHDELLRVVVLVEAARTILDIAQPPPLASTVRAELYTVLLSVLGACEQLSPAALASLTTCLARCVDSYTTRQQLPPLSGSFASDENNEDLSFYHRAVSWESESDAERDLQPLVHPSALEVAEAAQLSRSRAGLSSMVKPTEVLQHLAVLATVMQHRLEDALRSIATTTQSGTCGEAGDKCRSTLASAPSTVRLARVDRVEEGLLGLLTLQQRKEIQAAQATAAASVNTRGDKNGQQRPQTRPRRTVAVIQAEARAQAEAQLRAASEGATRQPLPLTHQAAEETMHHAPSDTQKGEESFLMPTNAMEALETTNVTLSDVAEVCTALAAMGYRGSGEEPLWALVTDFTCGEIDAVAVARDATACNAEGEDGSSSASALDEEGKSAREAAMTQLRRDARDVVFALDRVGCSGGYDRVMTQLVRCGFLFAPLPPPSATARGMRTSQ